MTNVPFLNSITNEMQKRKLKSDVVANALLDISIGNDKLDDVLSIQSSASEIDELLESKKTRFLQGRIIEGLASENLFSTSNLTIDTPITGLVLENSNDKTIYSTNSLKLGSSIGGASSVGVFRLKFNEVVDMTDADLINLNIYVDDEIVKDSYRTKDWGYIKLYMTNADGTNGLGCQLLSEKVSLQRGKNNVQVSKSQFSLTFGTGFAWSNIGGIRVVVQFSTGNNAKPIYLDSLSIIKTHIKPIPVCITLDDGTSDTFEMSKISAQYGVPTTHFIIHHYISDGSNGYMSLEQLKKLRSMGHAICMHETGINSIAWEPEKLSITKAWFEDNGFTQRNEHLYLAYPNGGYSRETMTVLNNLGFLGARTTANKNRSDSEQVEATKGIESLVGDALEPYLMGIAEPFQITGSKAQLESYFISSIDSAISLKKAYITCHHFFQELDKTTNSAVVGKAAWINVMKYLRTKEDAGLIELLTFPEFCRKYSK